jgi:hypothetical protein
MARQSQQQRLKPTDNQESSAKSDNLSVGDSMWKQLLIALFGGFIAAGTTLLGSKLAATQQEIVFKSEKYFGIQKDLLDKRFTLMERFIQISQKDIILNSLDMNEQLHLLDLQKSVKTKNAAEATKKIASGIQETEKYSALKAEYITVITMAKAIFGPETRKTIDALLSASNPKVWKADAKYVENVVLAMSGELTYGLSSVPANTHAE